MKSTTSNHIKPERREQALALQNKSKFLELNQVKSKEKTKFLRKSSAPLCRGAGKNFWILIEGVLKFEDNSRDKSNFANPSVSPERLDTSS